MTPAGIRHFAVIGHRGARAVAPENTLAGLRAALECGVAGIEVDVAMTSDGVCVLHHDPGLHPDIAREPDHGWVTEPRRIASLTLGEVHRLDVGRLRPGSVEAGRWPHQVAIDGTRIPTFDEACALVVQAGTPPVELIVEIKTFPDRPEATHPFERILDEVVTVLGRHGLASSAMVESFDWRVPILLASRAPGIRRGFLTSAGAGGNLTREATPVWTAGFDPARFAGSVAKAVAAAGGQVLAADHRELDRGLVEDAREAGLELLTWTVNDSGELERLLDLGVTRVITDDPVALRGCAEAKGWSVPMPRYVA